MNIIQYKFLIERKNYLKYYQRQLKSITLHHAYRKISNTLIKIIIKFN